MLKKAEISDIFTIFRTANPEPKTELEYVNHYTLLVAIILSAQATDVGVNKATKSLFSKIDNPEKMLKLGEEGLKNYIKTIGLFNSKAKNTIKMSEQLLSEYSGNIPKSLDELQKLAGVGRKTANVFLNCAHKIPTIGVDTHVHRVSNRIGLAKTNNPEATEKALLKKIPAEFMLHAHHWLILHGRYICKARTPLCSKCGIVNLCQFKNKNLS
jgi:endonuclease III